MNWLNLSSVKVGERLEYGYRRGRTEYVPQAVVKAIAVGRNWIKTDDGKKWRISDGREWGYRCSFDDQRSYRLDRATDHRPHWPNVKHDRS